MIGICKKEESTDIYLLELSELNNTTSASYLKNTTEALNRFLKPEIIAKNFKMIITDQAIICLQWEN